MKKLAQDLQDEIEDKIKSHKGKILQGEEVLQNKMNELDLLAKDFNEKEDFGIVQKIL